MLNETNIDTAIRIAQRVYQKSERTKVGTGVDKLCEELASLKEVKKNITKAERVDWLRKNWNTQELAAGIRYTVNSDVLAQMYALVFFQLVSLANDEWPILDTITRDGTFKTTSLGEANGRLRHQFVDRRTHLINLLSKFSTEWVEYQLMDLQTGDVSQLDRITRELTYEFSLGIDAVARTVIDATPLTSGLRKTLNLHKSMVKSTIPDSNFLDLSAVGGATFAGKLTLEKFKQILDYFVRFSSDVEIDGAPLALSTMFMSTVNKRDMWDFAEVVSAFNLAGGIQDPKDVVPRDAKLEIWNSGKVETMFGQSWSSMTRNTIPAGTLYCAANKPIGFYFDKPSMEETVQDLDPKLRQKNTGRMCQSKVHVFVQPAPWAYRMLKVKL